MIFLFFLFLFLLSIAGIGVLFGRHSAFVRALSEEELHHVLGAIPSPFQEIKRDYIIPFERLFKHTSSFLLYHVGEWGTRHIRKGFAYGESRVRRFNNYLHGRKIVMRKKGQSPFWDSIHTWKDEMKNGNGDKNINTPT